MNKREFAVFADALRTYYSKENILPNAPAMELWYRELQDIPYELAELVLRKWVATNKWSPSIAEIRDTAATITSGEDLTWGESWERVLTAVRRFGSYNIPEALESLDPITRKCVDCIGFREICLTEEIMATRAQYRQIFETISKREQENRRISAPVLEAISGLQLKGIDGERLMIGGGTVGR